jgi:hypothetical protein
LRTAVDKTFQQTLDQATASRGRAQERAQDLVDEVSQAASKLRDSLDDLRVATKEDVRELSDRLSAIERRLTVLEKPKAPARKAPARKVPAKKVVAKKPAANRSSGAKKSK